MGGFSTAVSGSDFSFLLRALKNDGRLQVLSRPQIVTADNKPATINVGQRVPLITDSRVTPQGDTINSFRYEAPVDAFSSTDVPRGREDVSWGITSLGYEITEHLGAAIGVSSYQPALDSRYRSLRFPFFDFSGTNANNYSQVFVNLNGTL